MSKQDRQGSRTVTDLERKYGFGQSFAELYGLANDARIAAEQAAADLDESLTAEEIFNRLTGGGVEQGVYRGSDGLIYINAKYINSGKVKAEYIDADNLKVKAANITGTLEATQINANNLKVNAANIVGAITARYLQGEYVFLKTYDDATAGAIGVTGASSADFAIDLTSYGSLRMSASEGNVAIYSGYDNAYIMLGLRPNVAYGLHVNGHLVPYNPSGYYCGSASSPWAGMYTDTDVVVTSDRNKKHSIEELPRKYVDMVLWLAPKRFKLNSGTSDRYHVGFIAQDVEEGMALFGIDSLEFGGWIKDKDEEGNDIYMLRYGEFIAIILAAVQDHEKRLKALEA